MDKVRTPMSHYEKTTKLTLLAGHFADVSTDLSFDWLAQQNGGQFDPQLFGDYREPQNNILNFEDSFFSEALDTDFLTPYNLPSTGQTPAAKNLIAQINEQQEAVEPPVKNEPSEKEGIDCFDVWYVTLQLVRFPRTDNTNNVLGTKSRAATRCRPAGSTSTACARSYRRRPSVGAKGL